MASSTSAPLTEAYLNPAATVKQQRFHRTVLYTPSSSAPLDEPLQASYALVGSPSPSAPVLIWINGLGHNRLATLLFDGLFAARGVRLLTVDRPGAGKSTSCPLSARVKTSHEALLAVLAQEGIDEFSILSHSNGVVYALYTLLHLPPTLRVHDWILSSPYVPPWHSSLLSLSLARYIPAQLTSKLGPVAVVAQKVYGPFAASASWSSGFSAAARELSGGWGGAGFVSPGTATDGGAAADEVEEDEPSPPPPTEQEALTQRRRFREMNAKRPPHEKLFGGEYYPPRLFSLGMKVAMKENKEGMGQEALICLRSGDAANVGSWFGEVEEGVEEGKVLETAFEEVKKRWAERGEEVRVSVVYGTEDALVPPKGRAWLKELLVDRLGMVEGEKWVEIDGAGHDDPLGLVCVIEPVLQGLLERSSSGA